LAPDILFNAGTVQRKYSLTAFVTCFQVFTAVVYQMVILFEVLQPVVVEPLRSAEAHNKTIV
jgi:hypothetical protein